jgi:signal transduction histidine kinase
VLRILDRVRQRGLPDTVQRALVVRFRPLTRVLRTRPVVADGVLAGLLWLVDLAIDFEPERSAGVFAGALTPVYAAVGYALLTWRRRYPVLVLAGVVLHFCLAFVVCRGYTPNLEVSLALYTVAAHRRLRIALAGLAATVPAAVLATADIVGLQPVGKKNRVMVTAFIVMLGFNAVIFGVGRWSAWTVRRRQMTAQRAAAAAAAAERRRIAHDLHDIVAHAVTLMLLQAGGAKRHVRTDPARAETALEHVDALGQRAIVELRRMLQLLSTDADEHAAPAGRLSDIEQLVARTTTDDLPVTLATTGEPTGLDDSVDVSAYRIVQEALTNAARYAEPGHPIDVRLSWHSERLEITVRNRPRHAVTRQLSNGRGIIGMRERAQAIGAFFTAGPGPGNTFVVDVIVPATSPDSAPAPTAQT